MSTDIEALRRENARLRRILTRLRNAVEVPEPVHRPLSDPPNTVPYSPISEDQQDSDADSNGNLRGFILSASDNSENGFYDESDSEEVQWAFSPGDNDHASGMSSLARSNREDNSDQEGEDVTGSESSDNMGVRERTVRRRRARTARRPPPRVLIRDSDEDSPPRPPRVQPRDIPSDKDESH